MKVVDVQVTAEDIAEGQRWDCRLCPVARALRRKYPYASVSPLCVELKPGVFGFPSRRMREFISKFDMGKRVEPSRFRLTIEIREVMGGTADH